MMITIIDSLPLLTPTREYTAAEFKAFKELRELATEITKDMPMIINGKTYINGELQ